MVLCSVYCVLREGSSIDRKKMDLLFLYGILCQRLRFVSILDEVPLTAYAMRSPLGSAESCVGCARMVLGEGANTFPIEHQSLPVLFDSSVLLPALIDIVIYVTASRGSKTECPVHEKNRGDYLD